MFPSLPSFSIPQRGGLPDIPKRNVSECPTSEKTLHEVVTYRPDLPIYSKADEIVRTILDSQTTVLAAPTGSGKSTQLPLMALDAGLAKHGMIGVLQPRRVAAQLLSEWVANLHGTPLGDVIGYHIGGVREFFGPNTSVKYMTTGILLGELQSDPLLHKYAMIVLDEVHERSVEIDLVMALLRPVLRQRPDLKLVVMSATLDTEKYSKHFDNAPVIEIPGRLFDVEVYYESNPCYSLRATLQVCVDKIKDLIVHERGDILAFLPDEATIRQVCNELEEALPKTVRIHALFGNQDSDEQKAVFVVDGQRRVIVATNIAETSVTIDGVRHVVDSGLIKQTVYINSAMSALQITDHSRSGCEQRSGRAGRTAPGICHRLMTRSEYEDRQGHTTPELLRVSLDTVLLQMRCLGYSMEKILALEFPDPPSEERWREAEARLRTFGALNEKNEVTPDGRLLNRLPVSPMLGRMILSGIARGCVKEMATVVAFEAGRSVMLRGRTEEDRMLANTRQAAFKHPTGDVLTSLKIWQAYQQERDRATAWWNWAKENYLSSRALSEIDRAQDELLYRLERLGIEITSNTDETAIRKAAASGLIVNLCKRNGRFDYVWAHGSGVFIHPGSALFTGGGVELPPEFMVCSEMVQTSKVFARGCSAIETAWIEELIPASELVVKWRVTSGILSTYDLELSKTVTWQGMELQSTRCSEELPWDDKDALASITGQIAETITGIGYGTDRIVANVAALRQIWQKIIEIRFGGRSLYWMDPVERAPIILQLCMKISPQLERARPRTLRDLAALSLHLDLRDWLTEQQVAEQKEQIRARAAYEQQMRDLQNARTQAQATAREQEIQDLRERYKALAESFRAYVGLLDIETIQAYHRVGRMLQGETYGRVWIQRPLESVESALRVAQAKASEKLALTTIIWTKLREQYPVCPLCGQAWVSEGRVLKCSNADGHSPARLVPLDPDSGDNAIAEIQTDRGEFIALVELRNGRVMMSVEVANSHPWVGKTFSKVTITTLQAILPPKLADQHDEIVENLSDLREMQAQHLVLQEQMKKAQTEHGSGQVKVLKFAGKTDDLGRPTAEEGIYQYTVPFEEMLTVQNGGTWVCRLGVRSGRDISVHPLFKMEVMEEDIEEMKQLLRESYEGIPEVLL